MYFIIFGILLDFTFKMLEIAIQDPRFQNFPEGACPRTLLDGLMPWA
jgi:hypothetical protein